MDGFALGVKADYDLVRGKTHCSTEIDGETGGGLEGRIIRPFDELPVADLHNVFPLHVTQRQTVSSLRFQSMNF